MYVHIIKVKGNYKLAVKTQQILNYYIPYSKGCDCTCTTRIGTYRPI